MSDQFITVGSQYAADTAKLQQAFARLSEKAQDGILRPIMAAASQVVAEAERAESPRESGLLAEAIGVSSTRTYRAAGSSRLFIAAGVRWGFRRTVSRGPGGALNVDRKSRPESGDAGARDPAKYLWLVTHGRRAIAVKDRKMLYDAFSQRFLGKAVAQADPDPFIQRAYDQVAPQVAAMVATQGAAAITQAAGELSS